MKSFTYYITHVVHNCVAHPLLPFAELCEIVGIEAIPRALYWFHDVTVPGDDAYNKKTFK